MSENRGKQFESVVYNAILKVPNTSIIRLIDPQNGYAGVRNICDFLAYRYPYQYLIECKSCHGNTLPFTNITDNQWLGMLEASKLIGVIAGVMVWFVDKDTTKFISIKELQKMKLAGFKSVRFDADIGINIEGSKKRVFFDYDMHKFFNDMRIATLDADNWGWRINGKIKI